MMKITLFALAALAVACAQETAEPAAAAAPAAPAAPAAAAGPAVEIVKQVEDVDVDKYNFEFETSDGTSRQETGEYKNDTEQQGLVVRGSYKYVAPDGQHIAVTYLADKNGYQPSENAADEANAPAAAAPQA
ncbi:endocuticle structural glycoprotein ABD-5-like [Spodoptera frugiperda]|uniref:Endocuticle structural glycoprotein ABD-5-like n=1 Tax=Spodoptera frugiperda TaxID=7108 RepID=A0A9R0DLF5_SPOFR|nr:endocuticle structural glycoprotein ABD-5-like [Spodoptera frugiperda]